MGVAKSMTTWEKASARGHGAVATSSASSAIVALSVATRLE
jgi:hypothetical protein